MFYILSHIFPTHPEFDTLDEAVAFIHDCDDDYAAIYQLDVDGQPVFVEMPC